MIIEPENEQPEPRIPGALPTGGNAPVDVDPEDWAASPGSSDDRLQRERPPHW
jgi:hypothetical protein